MGLPSEGRGGRLFEPPARLPETLRHSLTNVLAIGGQSDDRRAVASYFHQHGPLHRGGFVHLDCGRHEELLRESLQARLSLMAPPVSGDPLHSAWGGTLFLDRLDRLSLQTQRLLLWFVREIQGEADSISAWPIRLIAGCERPLERAVESGRVLPQLLDEIEKISVRLDPSGTPSAGVVWRHATRFAIRDLRRGRSRPRPRR